MRFFSSQALVLLGAITATASPLFQRRHGRGGPEGHSGNNGTSSDTSQVDQGASFAGAAQNQGDNPFQSPSFAPSNGHSKTNVDAPVITTAQNDDNGPSAGSQGFPSNVDVPTSTGGRHPKVTSAAPKDGLKDSSQPALSVSPSTAAIDDPSSPTIIPTINGPLNPTTKIGKEKMTATLPLADPTPGLPTTGRQQPSSLPDGIVPTLPLAGPATTRSPSVGESPTFPPDGPTTTFSRSLDPTLQPLGATPLSSTENLDAIISSLMGEMFSLTSKEISGSTTQLPTSVGSIVTINPTLTSTAQGGVGAPTITTHPGKEGQADISVTDGPTTATPTAEAILTSAIAPFIIPIDTSIPDAPAVESKATATGATASATASAAAASIPPLVKKVLTQVNTFVQSSNNSKSIDQFPTASSDAMHASACPGVSDQVEAILRASLGNSTGVSQIQSLPINPTEGQYVIGNSNATLVGFQKETVAFQIFAQDCTDTNSASTSTRAVTRDLERRIPFILTILEFIF